MSGKHMGGDLDALNLQIVGRGGAAAWEREGRMTKG
jgi:hypothetical protein